MASTESTGAANPSPAFDRGKLKVFLSFAPGVGKTFSMLDEAHRRRRRGADVVVGFVNPRKRAATMEEMGDLEQVPPLQLASGEEEVDVAAIIARRPEVVLIDDLAHSNAEGSQRAKRWMDVEALLDAGINVLTTVNVQHFESLNDTIADITGVRESETVPDRIFKEADEVELIDLTPRALINRLERGDIFPMDEVARHRDGFFSEGTLSALREIAMREAASVVDEDVAEFRREKRIERPWATKDRVLVCLSPTRSSLRLLRRGWRIGQRLHGDVIAVHVDTGQNGTEEQKVLDSDFALAQRLGIETVILKGANVAETVIGFAKERSVTQIILGHPERSRFQELFRPSILSEVARALRTVDILVVAAESPEKAPG